MRRLHVVAALALVALVVTEARRCRAGGTAAVPPDPTAEPEQEALATPEDVVVRRGDRDFTVRKTHRYVISGEVVSAWTYDWAWTSDFYDVDLGLVWGPDYERLKEKLAFHQDGRWLFWRASEAVSDAERADIERHVGNQHLIPAEGRAALDRAIRSAEVGDHVRISGWLVEIRDPTGEVLARSSTRRDDTGNGACEIVWVDALRIGGKEWR